MSYRQHVSVLSGSLLSRSARCSWERMAGSKCTVYNPSTYEVADVLSTYTYRTGLENQQYSLSTAVGLFNTMVNVVFLLITNYISKKSTESGLF